MSGHYWAFAEDLAVSYALTERPPFGFSFYHELPIDFVSLTYINNTGVRLEGVGGAHQILSGRRMAADFETAYLSYTKDIQEENEFSPLFRGAFAYKLASEICFDVTRDKDLQISLTQMAAAIKYESIEIDYRDQGSRERAISTDMAETHRGVIGPFAGASEPRVEVPKSTLPGF